MWEKHRVGWFCTGQRGVIYAQKMFPVSSLYWSNKVYLYRKKIRELNIILSNDKTIWRDKEQRFQLGSNEMT